MTADDPRPAGEARNPFRDDDGTCGRSFRSGSGRYYDCARAPHTTGGHSAFPDPDPRPAASGGATDGERELADEHRAENAAAAYEASEGQYGAPVASQSDWELEAVIAGTLAAYAERPWAATRAVLALPAVRQLLADAAKGL